MTIFITLCSDFERICDFWGKNSYIIVYCGSEKGKSKSSFCMQLVHTIVHNIWKVPWPLMRSSCEIDTFQHGHPQRRRSPWNGIIPLHSNKFSKNNVIDLFLYVYGYRESISADIVVVNSCLCCVTLQLPQNWQKKLWKFLTSLTVVAQKKVRASRIFAYSYCI